MTKIKEIFCLHHSHFDIGYTHPQPMLLALQQDYINQAIDLCLKTSEFPEESRFRWTVEATYPLLKWIETASDKQLELLKGLIENRQVSITALMMHTTPLCDIEEIIRTVEPVKRLKKIFNCPITTALNHDINGQPWPISQVLLDSGIDFYITGINLHFGGLPFKRPSAFYWKTPDNRKLLTYLGEHYSLFSQFFRTSDENTALMEKGINEYIDRLEQQGYKYDFIFLTGTNPPLFDNNSPDHKLAELFKQYNSEEHGHIIRFVTPEELKERVLRQTVSLPEYAGDWTDFWNFGAGSSVRDTYLNRRGKRNIKKAELLDSVIGMPDNGHYAAAKEEALLNAALYDEHTWGASESISEPDSIEVYSQRIHKSNYAYIAADLSGYLLGTQMENLAGNPSQSREPEGILLVNTSPFKQEMPLRIPNNYLSKQRHLSAVRVKQHLPYYKFDAFKDFGRVKLDPFTWVKIPFKLLEEENHDAREYTVGEDYIETPFYLMTFDKESGRITELMDKQRDISILNKDSEWTFFEFVSETIDPRYHKKERSTFFPRDVNLANKNISVWNHDWKGIRRGASQIISRHIEESAYEVTYVLKIKGFGVKSIEQRIKLSTITPRIELRAIIDKEEIREPESVYFAFPLNLNEGYRCHYDTAGLFVELDKDQMGSVCRDYITVDQTVSMHDDEKCITLACPDAPLVQIGDFNFGKEKRRIERSKNPLLLAWPLNNYWDTNFRISQPGTIELRYEFTVTDKFDPVKAFELGVSASDPVKLVEAVRCPEPERGTLLSISTEGVMPLYIRPSENKDSFVMTLYNLEDKENVFTYASDKVKHAYMVNMLDEIIEEIPVINGETVVRFHGRELKKLRFELNKTE